MKKGKKECSRYMGHHEKATWGRFGERGWDTSDIREMMFVNFPNGQEISSHRLKKCCETWEWTPWLWELLTPQTMRKSSRQQQKIVQRGSDRTDSWLSNRNVGIQKDNTMIFPKWWKENISLYSVKNIPQKWSQNNDFFLETENWENLLPAGLE